MAARTLPALIGTTENTLRSLLSHLLKDTKVTGYTEWVYLNISCTSDDHDKVDQLVAAELNQSIADVAVTRQQLGAKGLIDAVGGLTPLGHDQLLRGRNLVLAITEKLTHGIQKEQLEVTAQVLDTIRHRANQELLA